jgi:exodeoxyribonuclease-3
VAVRIGVGLPEIDMEGRCVMTDFGTFALFNLYVPNADSGPTRHAVKMQFLEKLGSNVRAMLKLGRQIVIVGDFNTTHREIDFYRRDAAAPLDPDFELETEERRWMTALIQDGFVDALRIFHPDTPGLFSW